MLVQNIPARRGWWNRANRIRTHDLAGHGPGVGRRGLVLQKGETHRSDELTSRRGVARNFSRIILSFRLFIGEIIFDFTIAFRLSELLKGECLLRKRGHGLTD